MPTSGQSVDETLQAMELRWVAAMQPSSRGTARLSSEMSASLPAWMTPSQTPKLHWSDRQQQRQEQHQQHMQQPPAPQLPLDMSASDDIIDVLEACGSHPQQAQWRHIWDLANASYQAAQGPMVAPAAWQLDVWSLQSIHWQGVASTGLSLAVSTPVSLKPSAICSSHARWQPQSLSGYAAFGKL
ncbi:TPA: hypothetical protein ACH3X3_006302 [Trebouxia sp. C0006]